MRFALSTNWNNSRLATGEEIVEEALALGFDALELGFKTTPLQLEGFRRSLNKITIDSIHAYCPVPVGAPSGHPELYQLLAKSEDERALARLYLRETCECASELGAKVIVFHAGYVPLTTFFRSFGDSSMRIRLEKAKWDIENPHYKKSKEKALKLREKRGKKYLDLFRREFEKILPHLEKYHLTLALENLPRIEGFPNADKAISLMDEFKDAPLKLWFDTGHAKVQSSFAWSKKEDVLAEELAPHISGIHLNDVIAYNDDHLQPGGGNVDFKSLKKLAQREDVLKVFEPRSFVTPENLSASLSYIKQLWS